MSHPLINRPLVAILGLLWSGSCLFGQTFEDRLAAARSTLASSDASLEARDAALEDLQTIAGDADDQVIEGQALLALGAYELLSKSELDGAVPLLERARRLLPEGSQGWLEATFGLATATQHVLPVTPDSIDRATTLFREILEHEVDSPLAARTYLNLGRIAEVFDFGGDQQDFSVAREHYQTVMTRWGGERIGSEAALRFGSTFIQEGYFPPEEKRNDWNWRVERMLHGVDVLKDWLARYPGTDLAPGIWEYIGHTFLLMPPDENLDQWRRQALEAYLHAAGDEGMLQGAPPAPEKSNMDRVDPGYFYFRLALLAHQQGLREIALEYYTRLIAETPEYARGPEAALQLTANLGFTRAEVLERVRWQLDQLGYAPDERERLVEGVIFLEPPAEGVPVPEPQP
jgi:tetratricopeptide (TPR) repeat protein